jgi:hypothetical protein
LRKSLRGRNIRRHERDGQVEIPQKSELSPALAPFEPPALESLQWLVAPMRAYFAPKLFGLEHVHPSKPALYVGNHSIYGLIDLSLFAAELYREKGIYLRGLADRAHFAIPGWGEMLARRARARLSRRRPRGVPT